MAERPARPDSRRPVRVRAARQRLSFLPLLAVVFFNVSGGPYGVEDAVSAFGPFWSFQVGWWSWVNSFVDVAVYPALFADYLRFWRPEMTTLERWLIALAFIWLLTAVNLAGIRITGWGAVALAVGALVPIVALTGVALARAQSAPW